MPQVNLSQEAPFCHFFYLNWFIFMIFSSPRGKSSLFPAYFLTFLLLRGRLWNLRGGPDWEWQILSWSFFFTGISGGGTQKIFFGFAGVISFIIIFFSYYYINKEEISFFRIFLAVFFSFIIVLVRGENLFSIFLGWEGVGLMSFLLIGWFSSREAAIFRAKKAIFYNRVGDFFFFILICLEFWSQNNLILGRFSISPEGEENFSPLLSGEWFCWNIIFSISLICCVIVKSAQFIFTPWLTSAMEGPTPVRALLHRRTIVVAGVFFFFLIFFAIHQRPSIVSILGIVRCFTNFITSGAAFFHKDLKKIIALSTARQLSFMVFILCLGLRDLALFHLLSHGFFKALLFLCSGVLIHQRGGSQERRFSKIRGKSHTLIKIIFILSNFALMGLPFLGAFWRKHKILDFIVVGSPTFNSFTIRFYFLSLIITMGYRLNILWIVLNVNKNINRGFVRLEGKSLNLFFPLLLLMRSVLTLGWILGRFLRKEILHTFYFFNYLTPILLFFGIVIFSMAHWIKGGRFFFQNLGFSAIFNREGYFLGVKLPSRNLDLVFEKSLLNKRFKKGIITFIQVSPMNKYNFITAMGFIPLLTRGLALTTMLL